MTTTDAPCQHNAGAAYSYSLDAWGDLFPGAWETPELALQAGKRTVQQNSLPSSMGRLVRYACSAHPDGRVELERERVWHGIDFLAEVNVAELEL